MSILNHSTSSCRLPGFPSKGAGTQDSNQHYPTSLPLYGTQVQKTLSRTTPSMSIAEVDASLLDAASFMSKKKDNLKNDDTSSFDLGSLFMGPLVRLKEEALISMAKQAGVMDVAMVTLAVSVSSAVELDERQVDLITRKMKRLTGFSNLRLENTVDHTLIAGFVISYGDDVSHVIDLSVKGQLATLASRIESFDR